jgi:hypothetical protein
MFAVKTRRFYFTPKLQTRLESIARDKHSSLFSTFVNDEKKVFTAFLDVATLLTLMG